jgi:hypothetical protein
MRVQQSRQRGGRLSSRCLVLFDEDKLLGIGGSRHREYFDLGDELGLPGSGNPLRLPMDVMRPMTSAASESARCPL